MHRPAILLLSVFACLAVQAAVILYGDPALFGPERILAGPDSYMRLLRMEEWWRSGKWYAGVFPHSNAPYGEVLHWTRPFDFLLAAGALPLMPFLGLRDALYFWGAAVSPILQVLSVLMLSWGTRRVLSNGGFVLAVILLSIQPTVRAAFSFARPDHHSLLLLLFVCLFALFLRGVGDGNGRRYFAMAGLVAGVAVWTSIEGVTFAFAGALSLGLLYCFRGGDFARGLFYFLLLAAGVLAVALPLERPPGDWLTVTFDRFSIVHLFLFSVSACAVYPIVGAGRFLSGPLHRIAACLAAAVAIGFAVWVWFPDFFGGPFGYVDPLVDEVYLRHVTEVQPLLGADLFFYLGPVIAAFIYLCHALRKHRGGAWNAAFFLCILLLLFVPLAVYQVRWSVYPQFAAIIPWTLFLIATVKWDGKWRIGASTAIPLRVPAFWLVLLAPMAAGFAYKSMIDGTVIAGDPNPCRLADVSDQLRALKGRAGEKPVIFSFLHYGPELIYRSGARAVGTPFHRNTQGITDTHNLLTAPTGDIAAEIVFRRRAGFLVFCRHSVEWRYYSGLSGAGFFKSLEEGNFPAWIESIPAAPAFLLLRVRESGISEKRSNVN